MFGYITIDQSSLSKEEKLRYRAAYCGLCKELGQSFGVFGQISLTYDLTFAAILLSSLYEMEECRGALRCVPHPVKRHPYTVTQATAYAADMNMILAYYKCLDDYKDDHNIVACKKAAMIKKYMPLIKSRRPRQYNAIEASITRLGRLERDNELNPDIPANCFGFALGELFVMEEDGYAPVLRRMGAALGRFIYILDACNDLHADIKKQRYNPLTAQMDTDFRPVLMMILGECTKEFESLPLKRDLNILRNILYSGVWMKYRSKKEGAPAI